MLFQIACGSHHTIILTETGSVYGFGQNTHGQLGLGDTTNRCWCWTLYGFLCNAHVQYF